MLNSDWEISLHFELFQPGPPGEGVNMNDAVGKIVIPHPAIAGGNFLDVLGGERGQLRHLVDIHGIPHPTLGQRDIFIPTGGQLALIIKGDPRQQRIRGFFGGKGQAKRGKARKGNRRAAVIILIPMRKVKSRSAKFSLGNGLIRKQIQNN